jgi:hypothetical protein
MLFAMVAGMAAQRRAGEDLFVLEPDCEPSIPIYSLRILKLLANGKSLSTFNVSGGYEPKVPLWRKTISYF